MTKSPWDLASEMREHWVFCEISRMKTLGFKSTGKPLTRKGIFSSPSSVHDPLRLAASFFVKGRQII